MSIKTKITVTASPQLKRNLNAEYTIGAPLKQYLTFATELIRDEASDEAPEDLGDLKRSHTAVVDSDSIPKWGRMEVRATSSKGFPYPVAVHEGTKPHFPPPSALAPWAKRHGMNEFALAVSISRKGTKPNPWLTRTMGKILPRLVKLGELAANISQQWNKP